MSVQVPEFFVYDQRMMEDRDERRERARERDRSQTYIPYVLPAYLANWIMQFLLCVKLYP